MTGFFVSPAAGLKADDLRVPGAVVVELLRDRPTGRLSQIRGVADVDAFLDPAGAFGPIQEHDILAQRGVPVNRGAPEGVAVGALPSRGGGEDGSDKAAQAGLAPGLSMPFGDLACRRVAIFPSHACDSHSLFFQLPGVSADEDVK